MRSREDQLHTKPIGRQIAALKAMNWAVLASIILISAAIEPASCQATATASSVTAKTAAGVKASSVRKPSRKRRVARKSSKSTKSTASAAQHADQNLAALTPHIDKGSPVKGDAEVTAVLKYGARKHAEGNFDEAEAAFRHVLSRDPSNVDAFYDLGALAERKGDLIGALSSYRAALALKPHDKEIADAVNSIEKTLRNRPAFGFRENHRPVSRGPAVPFASYGIPVSVPVPSPISAPAYESAPFFNSPVDSSALNAPYLNSPYLNTQNLPFNSPDYPPVVASPQLGVSADPTTVPPGTFQLSSAKNGVLAPTLGATAASAALPSALPSTPPVVGVAPRSHPVARQLLNTALNSGTSIGLRAVGLHCPACHLIRFRF
ncbi:MAG: tetratricopeptide repeat protein [Candidatus Obscuribacterales bacterium]|jgi:hypothetical protein